MGKETTEIQPLEILDMSGGLNSNDLSSQIKDNEWAELNNAIYYDGSFQMIPGFVRDSFQIGGSGSSTNITGIYDYQQRDTTQYLIITTEDNIYYKDANNQPASIKGTLTVTDNPQSLITWNDRLLGTDYANAPWTWDGTGNAVTLASLCGVDLPPAQAKYFGTFNDRAVLLNYVDNSGEHWPTKVAFSEIDNPLKWDLSLWTWELETDDAQQITGGRQLGEKYIVFKTNGIGYVTGYGKSSWTVNRSWKNGVGCVSGYTVKSGYLTVQSSLIEVIIFLSQEGYKAIDESGTVYNLPMMAENEDYKCYEYFDTLDKSNLNLAVGVFYRKRNWYFGFYRGSSSSTNDHGSIYNYSTNSLWPLKDITASAAAEVYNSTTGEHEVYIGSADGIIYRLSETTKGIESTTELITNGNMETGVGPTSWTDHGSPTTSERSNTVAFQGTYSNKIITDALDEGTYQDITTVIGSRYRIYAYGYVAASSDLIVEKEDTDGTNATTGTVVSTATTWTQMTLTFTATSTTSRIIFRNNSDATSTFYIDDASVRLIEVDSYGVSKYYDFGSEHDMKYLREFVPFVTATDTGGITFTITYDKGAGITTTDTLTLTSNQINWAVALDWDIDIDWDSFEELHDDLASLTFDQFRTLSYKVENNTGCTNYQYNKCFIDVKALGRRWYHGS
jgi:hypothetical protein